jgi:hypothetical protein
VGEMHFTHGSLTITSIISRILAHLVRVWYDYYTTAAKDIDTSPQRATH